MKKRNKLIRIGAIVALFSVVASAALSTTVTAGAVDEGKIIESVKGKIADIGQTQEVAYITARCCLMEWDLTTDKSRSFGVHAHGPYMDTADITISPWVGSLLDDDDDFDMLSFGGRDTTPSGQALLAGDVFHLGSFSIRGPITDHVYFSINFEDKVQVDLNTGPTVEYYLTGATGNGSVECNDIDNVFAKFAKALTNKSSVTGKVFETTIDEVLCGVDDPDFDIPGIVNCGGESKIDASKDYSFRSNDSIKKTILGLYNRYIREQGWFKGEMKSTACFPTSNECEKSDTVADLGYFDTVAGYGLYLRDIAGVTYSGSIYGSDEHYVDGNCGAIDYTDAQLMGLKILKGSVPEKGLPGGRLVSSDEDVMYFREYPNGNKNMYSFVGKVNGSSQPSCNDLVTAANKLALNETISGSRRDILDVYAHVLDSECYTAFSRQASYAQQRLTAYENKLAERQKTDPNAEYDQVEAEAVINLSNIINEFNSIKSDGEIKEGSSRVIFGGSDDTVMPRTNYYFIKIFDPADETKGMACKDDLEYLDTVDEMKYYDPATLEEEYDGEGCYDGNGALTWFACPMIVHLGDAVQGFYEDHIEPALLFDTRMLTYRAGEDNGTDAGFNAPDNTACSTVNESSDCQTCAESRNNGVYDEQACEACDEAKRAAGCSTNAEDYASEISDAEDVSSYAATANTYSVTRRLWNSVRTLANIGFFLIVVIVVFSQVTGFGLDNYNIKKILPKLVVSVVLINLSYVICAAAVDASNILGLAVKWLLIRATDGIGVVDGNYGSALAVIGIIVGLMVASAVLAQGWAIIFPVLAALLAGLICILFLFVVIYLRLLLIIACVVISPLAMVCYTLPNTKKLFDTWFNTFAKALLCFPLASFLVYGGRLGAVLLLAVSQGASSMQKAIVGIAALGVMVGPVLKIRSTIEGSFGMLKGAVAGLARVQGGLTRSAGNALNNNDIAREMRMNHQQNRAQNRLERRAGVRLDANGNIVERTPRTRLGRAFRRAADLANTHLPGQAARQKNQARARMMFAAQYDREAAYSQFSGDAGRQNLINKLRNTDERTEQQAVENERLSMLGQYDNGRVSSLINDTSGLKSIMDSSRTSTVPADQQQRRARAIVQQLSQSGDGLEELSRMVRGIGDYGGADYQTSRRELMNYMAADSGLMAKFEAEDGAAAQYIKDMYTGSTYTTGGTTYGANDHTFDSWASGTDTERGGNNMEFAFQQTVKKSQKFAEQGDYAMDDFLAFAQTGQRAQRDANGNATRDSKGGYIGDGTNIASTSQDTRLAQLLNVGSRADFSNKGKNESKIAGAYGAVKFSTSADSAGRAIQQFNSERRKRGGS